MKTAGEKDTKELRWELIKYEERKRRVLEKRRTVLRHKNRGMKYHQVRKYRDGEIPIAVRSLSCPPTDNYKTGRYDQRRTGELRTSLPQLTEDI